MRIQYFDSAKALASYLGIIYHSALIFTIPWMINAEKIGNMPVLEWYVEYINKFRMPLFLLISGYFAILSFKKYNLKEFLHKRVTRLLLPLTSTLFTFVIIQKAIKLKFNNTLTMDTLLSASLPWSSEFSLNHLWFLYIVLIYSFLVVLIDFLVTKMRHRKIAIVCRIFLNVVLANYALTSIIIIFVTYTLTLTGIIGSKFIPDHALLPVNYLFSQAPYFLLGCFYFVKPERFKEHFLSVRFHRLLVDSIVLAICIYLEQMIDQKLISLFIDCIIRLVSLKLVILMLSLFFNKKSYILSYMAESSYTVYLFHQPAVVICGFAVLKLLTALSQGLQYVLIVLSATVLTYVLDYVLIRKFKTTRFLFTGIR